MIRSRTPWFPVSRVRSAALVAVLIGGALCSSGCVYWRLLKFKGQLENFPAHMRVVQRHAPTLLLVHPVLKAGDPDWLLGLHPQSEALEGGGEIRRFRFVKIPEREGEAVQGDVLEVALLVRDGMLREVAFPVHFSSFLTQEHFMEVFLPIRSAMTDAGAGRFEWTWKQDVLPMPSRERIEFHLGPPSDGLAAPEEVSLYEYRLDGAGKGPALRMRYEFSAESEELRGAVIEVGRMHALLDFSQPLKRARLQRSRPLAP